MILGKAGEAVGSNSILIIKFLHKKTPSKSSEGV